MHLRIQKSVLAEPLSQVSKAVNPRSPIPIMTGIFFAASKTGLRLVGSDTAITIVRIIPEEDFTVTRLGSIVLPADKLLDIIASLPSSEIEINMKGKTAHISAGRSKVELVGMDADEFSFRQIKATESFHITGDVLRSLVKRTSYAALSKSDSNTPYTSIRLTTGNGRLFLTATDRHRAARVSTEIDTDARFEVLISVPHMNKVSELLSGAKQVDISFTDSVAVFSADNITIQTAIVDGALPRAIDGMFEVDGLTDVWLNTDEFADAVKLTLITTTEKTTFIRMNPDEIHLFGKGESGRTDDFLNPEEFRGDPYRVSFNGKLLLEALKSLESEKFLFRYTGESRAAIFSAGKPEEEAFIVQPYRVREEEWA